jgi:hypothetical protein
LPTHITETFRPTGGTRPEFTAAIAASPAVPGPLGEIPTGPEGAARPSIIVPETGGKE